MQLFYLVFVKKTIKGNADIFKSFITRLFLLNSLVQFNLNYEIPRYVLFLFSLEFSCDSKFLILVTLSANT